MLSTEKSRRIWMYLRQHRVMSIVVGHVIVLTVLGLGWLGSAFTPALFGALAQAPCAQGDQTYVVRSGDTLGSIAASHGTTWQKLSSYNHLANPNMIFVSQHICMQNSGTNGIAKAAPVSNRPVQLPVVGAIHGKGNPFPYGVCTWWASQRYFQVHGFFVPWSMNANAWQWQDRAREFHWHVSATPVVGSIINLQPGVQGASGLGHVALVESVKSNGHVIASNMNWGPNYTQVTNVEFAPGPGVSFLFA
ncbi:hypothetical protein KDA_18730 [Dictyobacter alpinus]|uniref:Peptidase C51 domain-containing protein n=1 Tax=Dictyobacter alpinus TaxID=2014873 RepID=A0A402B4V8_9CHLR|nr:LysM domain-containing protein [Dictyobacter alpinus]GCE26389.1 hypothetical protein KDA_18730 [Dictyobacter alpinus]